MIGAIVPGQAISRLALLATITSEDTREALRPSTRLRTIGRTPGRSIARTTTWRWTPSCSNGWCGGRTLRRNSAISLNFDVSFQEDEDEEIDATENEEDWIEYIKRSTKEADENMKKHRVKCWIEVHRRQKWRMARRIITLPTKRWNRRVFNWHPGLDNSIKAQDIRGTVVLIGQSVVREVQNKICSDRTPKKLQEHVVLHRPHGRASYQAEARLCGEQTIQREEERRITRLSFEHLLNTKGQGVKDKDSAIPETGWSRQKPIGANANRRALLCRKCSRESRNIFRFQTEEGRTEASWKRIASKFLRKNCGCKRKVL